MAAILKEDAESINVATDHQAWLQSPTTKRLQMLLTNDADKLVNFIAFNATNSSITDSQLRLFTVQLGKLLTINKLINETNYFTEHFVSHKQ